MIWFKKRKINSYKSKLSDPKYRFSKKEYYRMRSFVEESLKDVDMYEETMSNLTQWLYNIEDVYTKDKLINSLNDAFLLDDTFYIVTSKMSVWKDAGSLVADLLHKKIQIRDDVFTPRFELKKYYTFNKTWK